MEWYQILFIVIGVIVGLVVGFGLGIGYRKKVAEREIGSAEMEATRLTQVCHFERAAGESRNLRIWFTF